MQHQPAVLSCRSNIQIHELLGSGHFAKVHRAVATRAGLAQGLPLSFVLKQFAGEGGDAGEAEEDGGKEVCMLAGAENACTDVDCL